MEEKRIYELFKEKGALLEGHFLLTSGLHSSTYLQCAKVLQYPDIAEKLCSQLAKQFSKAKVDVVVSPAVGGIIVGQEVARALGARAIFAERIDGKMLLKRGFELNKKESVLAVEDVITTGGSLKEIIQLAKDKGCNITGVGSLVDRSGGKVGFGAKNFSLLNLEIQNYSKEICPLCKQGIPLTYLGSRNNVSK
ncbi:MAG: orotate phosphoribosyltransferase [Candidatus Ratteibacteria bacterium]|nr:orotate phosphoribosyltransferase [Candidatus Ratteibacteria bacterium]